MRHVVARVVGGPHDDASAREALAAVVIDGAGQLDIGARHGEGAEALAACAMDLEGDRAVGQALRADAADDLTGQHPAEGAVDVLDLALDHDRGALGQRGLGLDDDLGIDLVIQRVVLRAGADRRRLPGSARMREDRREIEALEPDRALGALAQQVAPADQVIYRADAELGHQLAQVLGHEQEVADDLVRRTAEALAQHRVLRGNADGARVEMADAHHDAARRDQRGGRKAKLLGPKQRADQDVATGAQAAVNLQRHLTAQVVHDQHLVRLGEAHLPRQACVLEARQRRGAGAAVMAGDHDVLGLGLGHAGRDRTHASLCDELDRDICEGVDALEVVDQLGEIFDRVDVVVRRRADQTNAGRRMTQPRDVVIDLVSGQLAALAGLGALRHLDLDLVGIHEVRRGHTEAARCHLLDCRAP